jgi:hypothetical protein
LNREENYAIFKLGIKLVPAVGSIAGGNLDALTNLLRSPPNFTLGFSLKSPRKFKRRGVSWL